MRLRAADGRVVVVAHRGAPEVAPENTLPGIEAALDRAVDVVEVDVSLRGDELVLAHSAEQAKADAPRLGEALAFFGERAAPGVAIQLDLKARGVERRVVEEVRAHELGERALVSSVFADVLRAVRSLEPALPTGLGYPHDRARAAERGLIPDPVVGAALRAMRVTLPHRAVRMARAAQVDALMLHHLVVSAGTTRRCRIHGIAVWAWTVNDCAALDRVLALGVDGVVTDRPQLLGR